MDDVRPQIPNKPFIIMSKDAAHLCGTDLILLESSLAPIDLQSKLYHNIKELGLK